MRPNRGPSPKQQMQVLLDERAKRGPKTVQVTAEWSRLDFVRRVCRIEPSPLLEAIIEASDGRPVTLPSDLVARYFGALPEPKRRRTIAVRAGGRGGKTSRMVATSALHAAWTVPVPTLNPGEFAAALIVAPDMRLARQALSFIKGYVEQDPMLRGALIGDPTKDHVELTRPDGKPVRVEVLPASARGSATRARTLVFAALDEAAFFFSEGNVVNDEEIYVSVMQRLVPDAQCWITSTPWVAHEGLLEKTMDLDWGKHERALCVTAPTRALNPTWDPTGEIERDLRQDNPTKAAREIDGIPMRSGSTSFYDPVVLESSIRPIPMPRTPNPGDVVVAGGDLGFRSDSSALAITHALRTGAIIAADLLELRPDGAPLKPSAVVSTFGERCRKHAGLSHLMADGHYRETMSEHLAEYGLGYIEAPLDVALVHQRARQLFNEGRVQIPDCPEGRRLVSQLRSIMWRPNPGGSVSILLPREAKGGHCDLAAAFVLALFQSGGVEVEAPPLPPDDPKFYERQTEAFWNRVDSDIGDRGKKNWWEEGYV